MMELYHKKENSSGAFSLKTKVSLRNLLSLTVAVFILAIGPNAHAQTTVNFTADSTMGDAMVANGGMDNSNFGSQGQLNVYHMVGQQIPMVFRTFIEYDISSIPENAIITDAKLKLVTDLVNNNINHPMYVERVSQSWDEATITWNNQPTVITGDQVSISHEQTSSSGTHEFDVTEHVQVMVGHPDQNNGWRIRLQSESASTDFGVRYHSSEAQSAINRPVLEITYVLPVEMQTNVTHCTSGNNDGELSVAVSGGSSYGLSNIRLYKVVRDYTQRGYASFSNYKTTGNVAFDAVTSTITAENLEPGVYMLALMDGEYVSGDYRLEFIKYILVGEEGAVTNGILFPSNRYQENVHMQYDKPTNANPLDRANRNYHSNSSNINLRVAQAPNNYDFASLIKYNIDFDEQLEFSKAELQMASYDKFYQGSVSSNAAVLSILTEDWEKTNVTWNTRPAIDSSLRIDIPASPNTGWEPVRLWDTINMMPFVDYWLTYPDLNYGFEVALSDYNQTQYVKRSYSGANHNFNFIEFEFSVKEAVAAEWNDTTNLGSITVNAPAGDLPYTYLIGVDPIGTLTDVWNQMDTTYMDSISFFTADIDTTVFEFTNLPSGEYHIAVFDNSGTKILDGSSVVNMSIEMSQAANMTLSASNGLTREGAQGVGQARLNAELQDAEVWGGLRFEVSSIGETAIGFNRSIDGLASTATDLEFGLSIASNGTYQIIEDNILLTSPGSLIAGDIIDLYREGEDYVVAINETEVYRDPITSLTAENVGIDIALNDGSGIIGLINYWGGYRQPSYGVKVEYPSCLQKNGSFIVRKGTGVTITSASIKNNITGAVTSGILDGVTGDFVFSDLSIATYTLEVEYTSGDIDPVTYVKTEQVAIGYPTNWENIVDAYVIPLNTIQRGLGYLGPGVSSADSYSISKGSGVKNWIQFETVVYNPMVSGSLGMQIIGLRNSDEEEAFRLMTGGFFVPKVKSFVEGEDWNLLEVNPNNTWRIDFENEDFDLVWDGDIVLESGTSTISGPYELSLYQMGSVRTARTITSYCTYIPDVFVEPKREIEGGFYEVPEDDILRFEFYKEYLDNDDLKYVVRDYKGEDVSPGLADLTEVYGDNRFELDVSSLIDGFYLMEIINDKGENWFIRFKVQ